MKHISSRKEYLLHWEDNPCFWNNDESDMLRISLTNPQVVEIDGKYYTKVKPHYTGEFEIVDCTCDYYTGDFYPIHTDLLIEL